MSDLHVWCVDDEEFVIATDAADALAVMNEIGAQFPVDDDTFRQLEDSALFTFDDGSETVTKTCGEWTERGRGHFASANY